MTRKPHVPDHVRGFKPGDLVITPLNRRARIVAIRLDGYLDARFIDVGSPSLAEVILQADNLRRVQ